MDQFRSQLAGPPGARGVFLGSRDAGVCEYVAALGWDFVVLDGEHGSVRSADAAALVRACELHGTVSIARVPLDELAEASRFLDAGVSAIMFPYVETSAQLEAAIARVRFPPLGRRGYAGPRSAGYGLHRPVGEFVSTENSATLVIAQIESRAALANLDAIAAVPGLDALFVGPMDLSIDLGVPGDLSAPAMIAAERRIAAAARAHGRVFGGYGGSPARLDHYQALGATLLATALEALIADGSHAFLDGRVGAAR